MYIQAVPGVSGLQPYQVHGAHRDSVFKTDTKILPATVVQMETFWKLCENKCRNHYSMLLYKQWGPNLEWKSAMKGTQKYRDIQLHMHTDTILTPTFGDTRCLQ